MLNIVINDYIYHVCEVPVIFSNNLFSRNLHQVYKHLLLKLNQIYSLDFIFLIFRIPIQHSKTIVKSTLQ